MPDENFIPAMTPAEEVPSVPELYNPAAAAAWSLLFTPVFGAWCILQNCKSLNDRRGVSRARQWIAGLTAVMILLMFLPSNLMDKLGSCLLLLIWLWGHWRPHAGKIGETVPEYRKKGWLRPIFCVCGLLFLIALLGTVVLMVAVRQA